MSKNINTIKNKLSEICKGKPEVAAAYLFGSIARRKTKDSSDVDVALLLYENKIKEFLILDFITILERTLGCATDVIVLNKADEVIKNEVRTHGVLAFERSEEYRKHFEIRSRKFYCPRICLSLKILHHSETYLFIIMQKSMTR